MTEIDVPLLSPGPDLSRTTMQALTVIGGALRERRLAVGRTAWTESENSANTVERNLRAADPPVREMTDSDSELFRQQTAAGAPGFETHEFQGEGWQTRATVGPLPEGRGWGVVAQTVERDSDGVEHTSSARVAVKVETEAKKLADEILTGGPAKVERLARFSRFASERAEHARTEVRETREQLMARTADAVRNKWSGELAERMIQPGPDDVRSGNPWNDALGALGWHLQRLEDRGYAMDDVLDRIGRTDALMKARNPAAMASSFVERMAPDLQFVNLDGDGNGADESRRRGTESAQRPDSGNRESTFEPADLRAAREALGRALGEAGLVEQVQSSRAYTRLQNQLGELHGQGRALDDLLAGLPTDDIRAANDPGGYLASVVQSRLEDKPLRKTRADYHGAAETVRASLSPETAGVITHCDAWPGLAKRIAGWESEGLPVSEMLASLPAERVRTANRPAAFATALLNSKAQSRRAAAATGGAGEKARSDRNRRDEQDAAQTLVVDGAGTTSFEGSAPAFSEPPLDPTSAVDRVGLEASQGVGTLVDDARIERLLNSGDAGGTHAQAATAELLRADSADRDAAHAGATPDDLDTPDLREDVAGQDEARDEQRFADAARTAADAEERGAQSAAALRADHSYRRPGQPPAATPAPRPRARTATGVVNPSAHPSPTPQAPRPGR